MPSRPLTIILNSNHTKRATIRVDSDSSPKQSILRESRNKFRQKALARIFLPGGLELEDSGGLPPFVKEVFIGKGEDYTGPPPRPALHNEHPVIRVIAERSFVDDKALTQLQAVARLPGVHVALGMPDLHPGNRFPIGCAIVTDGVYPALIGSDVGCGIALYILAPPSKSHSSPSKLAHLLRGLDDPWVGDVQGWLESYGIHRRSEFDKSSLGTVGAGNHFAEICVVENVVDTILSEELGIEEDALYLLVHTGSRGLGASILANQTIEDSNPYIPPDSPLLFTYLEQHDYAVQWAIANRDLVAQRIRNCLFTNDVDDSEPVKLKRLIDVTHNSVTKTSLSLNSGEDAKEVWIHRKGAAPADKGIVPCPGSRGDFSWLLAPSGDGQYNAQSLAHGAGRLRPRQALHTSAPAKRSLTTTKLGSEVVCTDPDLLIEERPEAYKRVEGVVLDMENKGICHGIAVLKPLVSYKVREGGERRS